MGGSLLHGLLLVGLPKIKKPALGRWAVGFEIINKNTHSIFWFVEYVF